MIKNIDGYLLTKSINHKLLVKSRPFTTAKAIDMYDHLKTYFTTLQSWRQSWLHVGTNDLPLNKTGNEIAEEISNLAKLVKKPAQLL